MSFVNVTFNSPWFGNQMFIYAFAKAYAEQNGLTLHVQQPWTGQRVFQLDDPPIEQSGPACADGEYLKWKGQQNITINGYAQRQDCAIYTRQWAKSAFKFKPNVEAMLKEIPTHEVCAHLRHSDYLTTAGFVAIDPAAYLKAAVKFGVEPDALHFVSRENPIVHDGLIEGEMDFLPDFYQLMKARVLFRANSTFSYWAALLSDAERVFAPRIDGIAGNGDGMMHHAEFEEGNHPRCAEWPFISDIHMEP